MCIRDRLTTAKTPFGHTVPVYDMERTICDLLRSRSRIEIQTFQGALKSYAVSYTHLDTIEDADGKERRVLNAKETTLAAQKQQAIREAFKDWIWRDPERRQTLVRQYNEEMNSTRPREYDGSHKMCIRDRIRLYSDVPEFRQRLYREVIDETYPKLHELLRPLSQEDIDTALCAWNGNIESKHLSLIHI